MLPLLIPDDDLKSRFRGCLLGQAYGDAKGFLVEMRSLLECRVYADGWIAGEPSAVTHRGKFGAGQISDGAQLALELARSITVRKGFDGGHFAAQFAKAMEGGKIIGPGGTTRSAAKRLSEGVAWTESGTPDVPSNGASERATAVGLAYSGNADTIIDITIAQARITHADPRSAAGATLIALATAMALHMPVGDVEPMQFLTSLRMIAHEIDETSFGVLAVLQQAVECPVDEALAMIAALDEQRDPKWDLISSHVYPSTMWALYAFLVSPTDFRQCIRLALYGGGDADSTAGMAGALAGAHLGEAAVPKDLNLRDRTRYVRRDIVATADALYGLRTGQ